MARYRALRGVCIGVERHLVAGEVAELSEALATYLVGIRAVELAVDEPPAAEPAADTPPPDEPPAAERPADPAQPTAPAKKSGKKE